MDQSNSCIGFNAVFIVYRSLTLSKFYTEIFEFYFRLFIFSFKDWYIFHRKIILLLTIFFSKFDFLSELS